jgi:hypothetical protein
MKKTYAAAIIVLVVFLLLAVAVFRGQASRELILKRNGLPMANLRADVLYDGGEVTESETSTDPSGRLDLSAVSTKTQMIVIKLWDGKNSVYSGLIQLPTRGSRTIDLRGNRTISTTTITYADFGLFKLSRQVVSDFTEAVGASK